MRISKIVFALGIAVLAWPVGPTLAEPPPLESPAPLTVPTPGQPKLRVPQMAPPPASLMLDSVRPLQMPQSGPRPTLNGFPGVEGDSNDDSEGMAGKQDEEPRLYLQHHH